MLARINRDKKTDKQTLGVLKLFDENDKKIFDCFTLELPEKDNQNNISCIPPGIYDVVPRTSQKFGKHFHIKDVPNRTYILIHSGNYYTQIRGCILVGDSLKDINNDGELDVRNSQKTLNKLLELAPEGFKLELW